jgi:hypothetical protein
MRLSRLLALVVIFAGLALVAPPVVPDALACCTPCASICGPTTPADTICCTGVSTPCDACGVTTCGACACDATLDERCAKTCDTQYQNCTLGWSQCLAQYGFCVDACWTESLTCTQPSCPSLAEDSMSGPASGPF